MPDYSIVNRPVRACAHLARAQDSKLIARLNQIVSSYTPNNDFVGLCWSSRATRFGSTAAMPAPIWSGATPSAGGGIPSRVADHGVRQLSFCCYSRTAR